MSEPAASARRTARELVAALAEADAALVTLDGIDLGAALEQQLFFAIRDGRTPGGGTLGRVRSAAAALARPIAAAAIGAAMGAARRTPAPGAAPLVALVREPTHYPVLQQIERELRRQAAEALVLARVGRAAAATPPHAAAPRLAELMLPGRALGALAHGRAMRRLATATRGWDAVVGAQRAAVLRRIAADELPRISLGTAAVASLVERWRPAVLVAFDEVGTWARILPAVGSAMSVPTLDLPHAETADADAVAGLAYDRVAVYGARAAEVLRSAGYPAERIARIGAPRFDPLIRDAVPRPAAGPRRVVFAAQYVSGAMQPDTHSACYRAALAAARAVQPSELVVVPHPAEPPGTAARLSAAHSPPPGVVVRLAEPGTLHAEIGAAWLLVTGWSNSIFEAAVAGIPAIAVNPGGVSPVDFAADGLALGAGTDEQAGQAAGSLLDAATRDAALARSRSAVADRVGELDGGASARAAGLILELARSRPPELAA